MSAKEITGVERLGWNPERKELEVAAGGRTEGVPSLPKMAVKARAPVGVVKIYGSASQGRPMWWEKGEPPSSVARVSGKWEVEFLSPATCRIEERGDLTEVLCE